MKNIHLTDLIYIAGFLDGDGSIMAQLVPRADYKLGFQIRLTVQFTQHVSRVFFLDQLQSLVGAGYVRRQKIGGSVADYVITDTKAVHAFLKLLQPYLRLKQKQANLVMTIIEQLPLVKNDPHKFIKLAEMADRVAELNDSKQRLHTAKDVLRELQMRGLIT